MSSGLHGKTVIVTGAASGIGAAMVSRFAAAGARVIAADIDAEGLRALENDPGELSTVTADVSSAEGAERIVEAARGRLDVLCNNAGVIDAMAPVDEASDEDWQRVLAINLTGPFRLCRAAIPIMLASGGGSIVNTASVGGLRGGRAGAAYTASKFGLVGLTQNIAVTHGPRGIRCNAICPGSTETGIQQTRERLGTPLSEWGQQVGTRDRDKPEPATPEQIAAVAVFLADPAASRINGAAIPVDGGWIAY